MSYENYRPSSFSILPPVVKNLLIINGIFFLATVVLEGRGVNMYQTLGLHFFMSEKFKIYQLFTYMFMHGSFTHLLVNMFQLWMFGVAIENAWGPKRSLQFYLICGLGAAAMQFLVGYIEFRPLLSLFDTFNHAPGPETFKTLFESSELRQYLNPQALSPTGTLPDSNNPFLIPGNTDAVSQSLDLVSNLKDAILDSQLLVGASGAIFGILLAFGMTFPNMMLYFYFFIPIKAKYAIIIFGVAELFFGVASFTNDNVAHFAHLGGLITGFIIIMLWRRRRRNNYYDPFN